MFGNKILRIICFNDLHVGTSNGRLKSFSIMAFKNMPREDQQIDVVRRERVS